MHNILFTVTTGPIEYGLLDIGIFIALMIGFAYSSVSLALAARHGLPSVKWLRYLGSLVAGSFTLWNTMLLLIAMSVISVPIAITLAFDRFNHTAVLGMLLIWIWNRPDHNGVKGKYV